MFFQNFQTHKKKVLDLTPGVNVLVGRTDVGKSALLRGLRWLALNQPKGAGFVRWGKSVVGVGAEVGGKTVVRVRAGKDGYYEIDGKRFSALNGTVPQDVRDLIAMTDLNFQRQIDPPLWFTLPPGKVAQELNRVVDLSLIDTALDRIGRSVRTKKAESALVGRRIQEAEETCQKYAWTVQYRRDKDELDKLELDYKESHSRSSRLAQLTRMVSGNGRTLSKREKQYASGVLAVESGTKAVQVASRRGKLEKLLKKVRKCQRVQSLPDFRSLLKIRTAGDEAAERRRVLEAMVAEVKTKGDELCQAEARLAEREGEMVKAAGNKCPTCGRSPYSPPTYTSKKGRRRAATSGPRTSGTTSSSDTWPN